jgi:type II secretory pathway component PulM
MNLSQQISGMNSKKLTIAGGAVFVFILFIVMAVFPMMERSRELDRKLKKTRVELAEISRLAEKYAQVSAMIPASLKKAGSGKNLAGEVEKIARGLGIRNNIKKISPVFDKRKKRKKELAVSINSIPLASFVGFVRKLHGSPEGIRVQRALIKPVWGNRNLLNAELTIVQGL